MQLRHEIAVYERARLRAGDEDTRAAYAARLRSLWSELRATSPRSTPRRPSDAPVLTLGAAEAR